MDDLTLKERNERTVRIGDPDAYQFDPEMEEILWEESAPLEKAYPEDFRRYLDWFVTFCKKTPCHVRRAYGQGFVNQKGLRKDGTEFNRPCYPDMIGRHLDLDRWEHNHPNHKSSEYFWVALRGGAKSKLKALDIDNKENVLGHYRTRDRNRTVTRPLAIVTVEQMQKVKRVYDAFPNHIWCVSSATLGLHVWEKLPGPQPLHLIEQRNRSVLNRIGLGKTEVYPSTTLVHRRPFGQDYHTITNDGLLTDWREQLAFFDGPAPVPDFDTIVHSLRRLMEQEWAKYSFSAESPIRTVTSTSLFDDTLANLDQWKANGFPLEAENGSTPVEAKIDKKKGKKKGTSNEPPEHFDSFDGDWCQRCRQWAMNGLNSHNQLFFVLSQLAKWFFFIEFFGVDDSTDRITALLIHFATTKHNGFITRLNHGQQDDVESHIVRIIDSAITSITPHGLDVFSQLRNKRDSGKYKHVWFLEPLLGTTPPISSSSSVLFNECCTVSDAESVPAPEYWRKRAENWVFVPNDNPLPKALTQAIIRFYDEQGLKMKKPTNIKILRFLNHLWGSPEHEARLGIESLKKMGFGNHAARKHIKRLEDIGVIQIKGYCPVAGLSTLYRLRQSVIEMFSHLESTDT